VPVSKNACDSDLPRRRVRSAGLRARHAVAISGRAASMIGLVTVVLIVLPVLLGAGRLLPLGSAMSGIPHRVGRSSSGCGVQKGDHSRRQGESRFGFGRALPVFSSILRPSDSKPGVSGNTAPHASSLLGVVDRLWHRTFRRSHGSSTLGHSALGSWVVATSCLAALSIVAQAGLGAVISRNPGDIESATGRTVIWATGVAELLHPQAARLVGRGGKADH
jgi:hypothetical protein